MAWVTCYSVRDGAGARGERGAEDVFTPQAPRQHPEVDMPKRRPRRRSVTHSPTSHAPATHGTHSPGPVTSKTYTSLSPESRLL
jgi:hypothetical protein